MFNGAITLSQEVQTITQFWNQLQQNATEQTQADQQLQEQSDEGGGTG